MIFYFCLFIGKENAADKQAHNAGKVEAYAPDCEKVSDQRLCRLGLENAGKAAAGAEIVVKYVRKYIDCQTQDKGPKCKTVEFFSHLLFLSFKQYYAMRYLGNSCVELR